MTLNVPFLSGCFMFLRTEAVKEVGLFDERFFLYAEDIDFTRRMHSRYKTVFYPPVPVYHKFSRASRRSFSPPPSPTTARSKRFRRTSPPFWRCSGIPSAPTAA